MAHSLQNQCLWLLSSCTLPFLSAFTGFHGFFAVAGVLVYLAFLVTQLLKAKQPPLHHEKQHHDEEVGEAARAEEDSSSEEELRPTSTGALYLLLGGILILAFAEPFISSVSELAASFEVNPILLAFFLAPVASEMPEILESISLSRKGKEQTINVAFSNLVGSDLPPSPSSFSQGDRDQDYPSCGPVCVLWHHVRLPVGDPQLPYLPPPHGLLCRYRCGSGLLLPPAATVDGPRPARPLRGCRSGSVRHEWHPVLYWGPPQSLSRDPLVMILVTSHRRPLSLEEPRLTWERHDTIRK